MSRSALSRIVHRIFRLPFANLAMHRSLVIVRQGVRPDGRSLMVKPPPAEAFTGMHERHPGRIIAFLKNLPPVPGEAGSGGRAGPLGRVGLVTGKFKTAAQLIA